MQATERACDAGEAEVTFRTKKNGGPENKSTTTDTHACAHWSPTHNRKWRCGNWVPLAVHHLGAGPQSLAGRAPTSARGGTFCSQRRACAVIKSPLSLIGGRPSANEGVRAPRAHEVTYLNDFSTLEI